MRRQSWEKWYDDLPQSTKVYLSKQPLWHDIDMFKAVAFGFVIGIIVGLCF